MSLVSDGQIHAPPGARSRPRAPRPLAEPPDRWYAGGVAVLAALVDLVLPTECAGCDAPAGLSGICADCVEALATSPEPTRPDPAPPGLPPCFTAGWYDGVRREVILSYKERGRRGVVGRLADALADTIVAALGPDFTGPVVLVPVPSTAAAIRARQGDHMLRLARRAARRMRRSGIPATVATPLRALPKEDSAHLDRQARARVAGSAFAVRPARLPSLRDIADTGVIAVVDDVLTTGSTLAAVARLLFAHGVPVAFGATVAATRLRHERAGRTPAAGRTGIWDQAALWR
ncbi:MAG TPA: ComF family protein [Micromonosporaceae bacterium]